MQLKDLQKTHIMLPMLGAAVLAIGSILPWFSFENTVIGDLANKLSGSEIRIRQNITLIIGLFGILITVASVTLTKRYLKGINVFFSLFAAIMIFNQYPSENEMLTLNIESINFSYYLAALGAITFFLGSLLLIHRFHKG